MHPREAISLPAAAVGLALGVIAAPVAGQSPGAVVTYEAPPGCPSSDAFQSEIRARTPLFEAFAGAGGVRVYSAAIHEEGPRFAGRLTTTEPDGTTSAREVVGDQCRDAASALALIIAMAIDPNASTAPASALAPMPAPAVSSPPPRARPAPVPAAPTRSRTWGIALDGVAAGGVAPGPALGGSISAETSAGLPTWFPPSVRFGLTYADNALAGGSDRTAAFRWLVVPVQANLPGASLGARVRLAPWVTADAGVIQAQGRSIARPQRQTRLWVDVGLLGRMTIELGSGWFLEAEAGGVAPLARRAFVFEEPRVVVHEIPWVSWRGGIGVGALIL